MSLNDREIYKSHAELFKPSAQELDFLKEREPQIKFEVIHPFGISEGRQSRVSVLEFNDGQTAQRVMWKRMGEGKGLTINEAESLRQRLLPYQNSLIEYGWRIPELYYSETLSFENEARIFSYDQFIPGGDGEKMVANPNEPNFKKWFLVRKTIETLAGYPDGDTKKINLKGAELTLLPHGLDLKLANIVLSQDGILFFVDLFGPKELNNDGTWRTYSNKLDSLSQENLLAITATREGAILRFYRLAEKFWMNSGGITEEILRNNFFELIAHTSLPEQEKKIITNEIQNNFPWLDSIYSESRV